VRNKDELKETVSLDLSLKLKNRLPEYSVLGKYGLEGAHVVAAEIDIV